MKTMPCAGQDISKNLKELIIKNSSISLEDGRVFPFSKEMEYILTNYVIEDIKASVCFVGQKPDPTEIIINKENNTFSYRSSASEIGYPMEERRLKVNIPGWVRERAAEILFDQERNEASIASLVIDSLQSVRFFFFFFFKFFILFFFFFFFFIFKFFILYFILFYFYKYILFLFYFLFFIIHIYILFMY